MGELKMYLEDVPVGREFEVGPREVTLGDVRAFSEVTGDRNPIHRDEAYAQSTPFGRVVVHGMLTLSLAFGLWSERGYTREGLVALVGLKQVRFRQPVFPGDALRLRSKVVSVHESASRPGRGFVAFHDQVMNQREEVVLECERTLLMERRPTA